MALVSSAFAQSKRDEGIGLYQEAKYQSAVDVLQEVINRDEKDRVARMFLGAALFQTGNRDDAVKEFRKGNLTTKELSRNFDSGVEFKSKPRPSFTDTARSNFTQGVVRLAVEFLADGKIGFMVPVQTLPDGLTENCRYVAKRIKFNPAQKDGKPVTTVGIVEFTFSIQ
jgi:tetratricopeptide (TPR) repeat protein